MKNTINFLCLAVACTLMCCAPGENTEEQETVDVPATLATVMVNDDCFDQKMEAWFFRFNQFQEEGDDLHEANDHALAAVAEEFIDCSGQNERMATEADTPDE
jgi:hypothetical protein